MPTPQFILDLRQKIGNAPLLLPGVCAIVFNDIGQVLLQKRADTGRWSTIGGISEPGEEPSQTAVREVLEETSVTVVAQRLIGVYTTPVITYGNGDVAQYVIVTFRCRVVSGEPKVNDDESLDVKYFDPDKLPADLKPEYRWRVEQAVKPDAPPFF